MTLGPRTLVTGGAGYIGSILVDELLARGGVVRVLDSLLHGSVPSLLGVWGHERFEFVRGDVRDAAARSRALADVDAIVHLAAIVGDPACSRQPELAREVNVEATRSLLRDAEKAGVQRVVFASTCSNYGKLADPDAYANEDWELSPVSLYAETKVEAELEVLGQARNGLPATCLRLATVYGASPRMRFDLTVNEFVRDLASERELVVYGEQFWRPYVHVRDAARAVAHVLTAPRETVSGRVFNVGETSENYRKLDLVALLRKRIEAPSISFVHKDEDPRDYKVSFERIKDDLGFQTEWTVSRGMDEVLALMRSGLLTDPYAEAHRN